MEVVTGGRLVQELELLIENGNNENLRPGSSAPRTYIVAPFSTNLRRRAFVDFRAAPTDRN